MAVTRLQISIDSYTDGTCPVIRKFGVQRKYGVQTGFSQRGARNVRMTIGRRTELGTEATAINLTSS